MGNLTEIDNSYTGGGGNGHIGNILVLARYSTTF